MEHIKLINTHNLEHIKLINTHNMEHIKLINRHNMEHIKLINAHRAHLTYAYEGTKKNYLKRTPSSGSLNCVD
jgi:hypothetical protein